MDSKRENAFLECVAFHQNLKSPTTVKCKGTNFVVFPKVFNPVFFDSRFLASNLPNMKGKTVLDVGTGCGIQAITAAKKGAKRVVAIDISKHSIKNAKNNVERYGLSEIIDLRQSDLFDNLNTGSSFDYLIFNPPFHSKKPRNIVERLITDENYSTLRRFLMLARNYLSKNGKILLIFSDVGEINKLIEYLKSFNYQRRILRKASFDGFNYYLFECVPI